MRDIPPGRLVGRGAPREQRGIRRAGAPPALFRAGEPRAEGVGH